MAVDPRRYSRVAMTLHWLIALAIIALIPMGMWMSEAIADPARAATAYQLFQLHKSIGLTVLVLSLVRLGWRLIHPVPPLPAGTKPWEAFVARATHAAFYALMILMPLSGWVYVSAGWAVHTDRPLHVATSVFGLFEWPYLSFIAEQAGSVRRIIAYRAIGFHEAMAMSGAVLIVLHIAAALKHQFVNRDAVLPAMMPFVPMPDVTKAQATPGSSSRLAAIAGIAVFIAAAAIPAASVTIVPGDHAGADDAAPVAPSLIPAVTPTPLADAEPVVDASESVAVKETPVPPAPTAAAGPVTRWAKVAGSTLGFSFTHAGAARQGSFDRWEASIAFDPDRIAETRIGITIATGSARTGDATQESTLAQGEWFNSGKFPEARFVSSSVKSLGGDRYQVNGSLSIRDKTLPLSFPATIRVNGRAAEASGNLVVDRVKFGLGMQSDPGASWVSAEIPISFRVKAEAVN